MVFTFLNWRNFFINYFENRLTLTQVLTFGNQKKEKKFVIKFVKNEINFIFFSYYFLMHDVEMMSEKESRMARKIGTRKIVVYKRCHGTFVVQKKSTTIES